MYNSFSFWFKAARSYTFALSAVPYILGAFLASVSYDVNLENVILGLIGILLVHASFNLLDDYQDWISGNVASYKDPDTPKNTRKHKAFYLEEKIIDTKKLLSAIFFCWSVALFIGAYLAYIVSFTIFQIAMIGALAAMAYTLPPLDFNSKGLGELTIGFIFGPLIMNGAYIASGGMEFDTVSILTSVIIGILIANTAHTHSILDYDADFKTNKRTLSICLLSKSKAIFIQLVLYIWAYLFLFAGIVYNVFPKETLLTLFTFPLTVELNELMFNNETYAKLWYGPITHLKNDDDNYFMLRLCIARNVVIFFAFLFGLTYYIYS